jgi:hypothetical protein
MMIIRLSRVAGHNELVDRSQRLRPVNKAGGQEVREGLDELELTQVEVNFSHLKVPNSATT